MKAGKVWGETRAILQNPFVEMHVINGKKGYQCSMHCHEHKSNAFYVVSGKLDVYCCKRDYTMTDVTSLGVGEMTIVPPGEYHWFAVMEDCEVIEIYFPSPLDPKDIIRRSVGGKS